MERLCAVASIELAAALSRLKSLPIAIPPHSEPIEPAPQRVPMVCWSAEMICCSSRLCLVPLN